MMKWMMVEWWSGGVVVEWWGGEWYEVWVVEGGGMMMKMEVELEWGGGGMTGMTGEWGGGGGGGGVGGGGGGWGGGWVGGGVGVGGVENG